MDRTVIVEQTEAGRTPVAVDTASAVDIAKGNEFANGAGTHRFRVVNTHATDDLTVVCTRLATGCPTCNGTAEPAGAGSVTLDAGEEYEMGPFDADLYGQGEGGLDLYFTASSTGSGTGTIIAYPCVEPDAVAYSADVTAPGDRVAIAVQTPSSRAAETPGTPTDLDKTNGNYHAAAAGLYRYRITNTSETDSITVTCKRNSAGCPKCLATAEPSGKGAVTLAAGESVDFGPFGADLYGQDESGTALYFDTTGDGTGTIIASAIGS